MCVGRWKEMNFNSHLETERDEKRGLSSLCVLLGSIASVNYAGQFTWLSPKEASCSMWRSLGLVLCCENFFRSCFCRRLRAIGEGVIYYTDSRIRQTRPTYYYLVLVEQRPWKNLYCKLKRRTFIPDVLAANTQCQCCLGSKCYYNVCTVFAAGQAHPLWSQS